ncbi:MAG: YifB family Mg chelatase-like AAA ATPase [Lachnospiraceae bacterium]|nr:YifB family Mg chelatase-like AAA ATPase [Lachnospiraceae bacterium]
MVGITYCAALSGVEGVLLAVEADASEGFPQFEMVGLLASEVREARERVRTAIGNSGYELPVMKYTINLSPADIRKAGNYYDLPIAIAVLSSIRIVERSRVASYFMIGELSLEGVLRPVSGTISFVIAARKNGFTKCIVPSENAKEAALIEGMEIFGFSSLKECVRFFVEGETADAYVPDPNDYVENVAEKSMDFSEIVGQENLKRAAMVACAGLHNMLMIGPPGSGKTMLARRIPTILPPMSLEEAIEVTGIHSVCGLVSPGHPLITARPFRSPHHTSSAIALVGGGSVPHPGEMSLAHRGVLFLDELPEFGKQVLEVMRQPLEDRRVVISRIHGSYVFPTSVMLVAAMNPCNCGYYPDRTKCKCNEHDISRYLGRISRPILDRIDITVEAARIPYDTIKAKSGSVTSEELSRQVCAAMEIQRHRYDKEGISFNSQLSGALIKKYCRLGKDEEDLMKQAYETYDFSTRTYTRVLKVARTIADLEASEEIRMEHLSEAVRYRSLEHSIWKR